MRKYNENLKNPLGLHPSTHQGSALDPLGGAHSAPHPTNLQLIIAIAAPFFYENIKKKNDQLIFPYFDDCLGESKFTRANWALGPTHSWRTKQISVSIPRAHTYT